VNRFFKKIRSSLSLLVLTGLLASMLMAIVPVTPVLASTYEGFTNITSPNFWTIYNPDDYCAQTFNTTSAHDVDAVSVYLTNSNYTGDVIVEIMETTAGKPSGGVLTTGSYNVTSIAAHPTKTWVTVPITNYSLLDATLYAIIMKASAGDAAHSVNVVYDNGAAYAGGDLVNTENDGVNWTIRSGYDAGFEIHKTGTPSVITNAASGVTGTSVTLNGNVTSDGDSPITERGFYFGTASPPTTKYVVAGTTGAFSKIVASLSGGTTYYFRAYAINNLGETKSSILSFATLGGQGSEENPYIITSVEGLQAVSDDLSAWYELGSDIDASATSSWNSGNGFDPIGIGETSRFEGHFDGKGRIISNLYINRPGENSVGLFTCIGDGATVQNVSVIGGTVVGNTSVGGIAGSQYYYSSTIYRASYSGSVEGALRVGGLVGTNNGNIIQCFTTGSVQATNYGGGLVGYSDNAHIEDSYSTSSVNGTTVGAGFLGRNQGASAPDEGIFRVYSVGSVTGFSVIGGLTAEWLGTATVSSFWDTITSGQATSATGTGKTTTEMQTKSTFTNAGWDFTDVWEISAGEYPTLQGFDTPILPTVITGTAVNTSTTGATLQGILTSLGSYTPVYVHFEYGLTTSYATATTAQTKTATESFNQSISGLTPGTIYHFRAVVRYDSSFVYGTDSVFTTTTIGPPLVYGEDTIQEYYNTGDDADVDVYGVNMYGQSFTTGATVLHTVSQVRVEIFRVGLPGTLYAEIYGTSADHPTGLPMGEGSIDGDALTTDADGLWYTIELDEEIALDTSELYCLVLSVPTGTAAAYVGWNVDTANGYADGAEESSTDSGVVWSTTAANDMMFEIWGNQQAISIVSAKAYSGFIETDDQLYVFSYKAIPDAVHQNTDSKLYFNTQLELDGTVRAQGKMRAWGFKVSSLYLDSTEALPWGSNVLINLDGVTGSDYGGVTASYLLSGSDWAGEDLEALDDWVISTAMGMEDYYVVPMTTPIEGKVVLNERGGTIFTMGIPYLPEARSGLFGGGYAIVDLPEAEAHSTTYQDSLTGGFGDRATAAFADIGDLLGVSGGFMSGAFWFYITIIGIAVISGVTGNPTVGVICAIPLVLVGNFMGVISLNMTLIVTFCSGAYLIYKVWITRS